MSEARKILVGVNHIADREAVYLRRLEEAGFTVVRNRRGRLMKEDELIGELDGVFGTVAGGEPYTERVFSSPSAQGLRIIARFGVGYDQVDVAAATRHKVVVAMAFGTNHEAVADGAFALLAGIVGDLRNRDRLVREGGWGAAFHIGLWHATVGVLGLGRIGRAFARRCKGFEMKILAHDPQPDTAYARAEGIELVSIEDLFRRSDFISLHAPHTKGTENLVGARLLGLMKPTAYLVNTARGSIVDEDALYQALKEKRIAGAGIDAFKREPPTGSPLLTLPNVLLTPHSTGMDVTSEHAMANRCIDSILAWHRGEDPGQPYVLNPEVVRAGRR